ncbi:MAG: porin family protein, partial [Deltaproteobacteria bacterium]|nr:porin family protein [Deltaproteobacteria bacterium]
MKNRNCAIEFLVHDSSSIKVKKREGCALKIFVAVASGIFFLFVAGILWAEEEQDINPHAGFYLSFTPSVVFPFSVDTTSHVLSPGSTRTQTGWGIAGGPGYRYGDFRVEAEVLYGRSDADHVSFSGGGGDLSGYYDMWGITANFYYDIPTGTKFRPYVGAGLGGTHFTANDITLAGGFPSTHGSNTLFTYKLMAGVSYVLTDAWRVFLGYRFMGMGEQDYETGGIPLEGDDIR